MLGFASDMFQKAQRVLNVSYRPRQQEWARMAKITGIGIVAAGIFGTVLSKLLELIYL